MCIYIYVVNRCRFKKTESRMLYIFTPSTTRNVLFVRSVYVLFVGRL